MSKDFNLKTPQDLEDKVMGDKHVITTALKTVICLMNERGIESIKQDVEDRTVNIFLKEDKDEQR